MAPQTWRTYQIATDQLTVFRKNVNLPNTWPVPMEHMCHFIAHLSLLSYAPSTIATYVSGIGSYHRFRGWEDPGKSFVIRKMIEGVKRDNVRNDIRSPITMSILSRIVDALNNVCTSQFESVMFKAAFQLAFFAFLRIGELSASSKCDLSGKALKITDVKIRHKGASSIASHLQVCIRSSKTDQRGKTCQLLLKKSTHNGLCPVVSLYAYLNIRPSLGNTQLFVHHGGCSLTRYQFCAVLQKTLKFCGILNHSYKSHSFRIGAATEAAMRGVPDETIKQWGRWRSGAYSRYIRIPIL